MSVDVSRRHPMELFVAQRGEHFGKGLAQRIDLPVHEHARVDGDALRRGQVGRTDESVQRTVPAVKQIPEQPLRLGEVHPSTSVSTSRARRLSSSSRSSSGT